MTDQSSHDSSLEDTMGFADNPEPRCPCILVLDVSGSMRGPRMDTLNQSIQDFKKQVCEDELTSIRAEIAIIAFSDHPRVAQEFVTADKFEPKQLDVEGGTKIGIALVKALDMAEERKRSYRTGGINYYRPIIVPDHRWVSGTRLPGGNQRSHTPSPGSRRQKTRSRILLRSG